MKQTKFYTGVLALAMIFLASCKNDLDVLAPGEETVSVYGVINPNEPVQNIRINKVYLTNGDALAAGQDANQINYGAGELKVTLQRFMTGSTTPTLTTVGNSTKKEIVLTETVVTTAGGDFNVNQRIWQTTDKLYNSGEYKLTITNISSGKEFTAQTLMVDSVKSYGGMPFIFAPPGYPVHCGSGSAGYVPASIPGTGTQQVAYVDYHVLTASPKIKFKSVPNAKLYNVIMRFHYIDSLTDGVTGIRNYVDMTFPSQRSSTMTGGEPLEVSFNTTDFYSNLANQIPKKTVGSIRNRTAHYMEYIIYACSENMDIFLQVNQPSTSIAQNKPNYTNISGGVGIFASISKTAMGKELWSDFIDEIATNQVTSSLQFVKRYTFICP
ncbi:MAG: hypothetical protein HY062_08975 [Bacteroidetes bacterium]|nr:hypothetical protein [Bacteroidota bacterium]